MKNNEKFAKELAEALIGAIFPNIEGEQKKDEKTDFRKNAVEAAKPMYETYLGFMDAGFNEKQAFALLMSIQRKGE